MYLFDYIFPVFRKIILIIGWIIFIFIVYKTSQVELDFSEFDPYAELGIDRVKLFTLILGIILRCIDFDLLGDNLRR